MGPAAGLILGLPFIVAALSLLVLLRRERLRRERHLGQPGQWLLVYQVMAALLVAFVGANIFAVLAYVVRQLIDPTAIP
jgi:hypothetical protein